MTRREFVINGLAALTASGVKGADGGSSLPLYYDDYLNAVSARIRGKARECVDGFYFITDLHVPANKCRSGHILAALKNRTPIFKTLCGGDLTGAFTTEGMTDRGAIDKTVNDFLSDWVGPIRESGMKLYTAKGNHDFTIRHSMQSQEGSTYSAEEARRIVMGEATEPDVVTNASDSTGCYYYFDNSQAHIRYIVCDTSDAIAKDRRYWAVEYSMGKRQLCWLAENALATVKPGWSIVVMHHIPVATVVGRAGEALCFANMRNLLEAYQNRKTVSFGEKTYDFANAGGHILFDLTGHQHSERQTYQNGVLHVTTPCDAAYGDYIEGSAPWDNNPKKAAGTIYEQTFDAVQLDVRGLRVLFTRIGGGTDRVISLAPLRVRVGENLDMANVGGELGSWGCYDCDRVDFRKDEKIAWIEHVNYFNDIAVISKSGSMTTRKRGNTMVVGSDKSGCRFYFPVEVR